MASKLYEIAFQIGGKLQASFPKSMTTAAGQLDAVGKQIAALEKAQGTSNRFRGLHNEIDATKLKLRQAEAEMRRLDGQMRTTSAPTAQLTRQFADAQAKVAALRTQFRGEVTDLKGVQLAMAAAGMSARTLAADNAKLAANLAKAQATQRKIRENLGARAANKTQREDARTKFNQSAGRVIGAAAGVAAWVLPLKLAADFEDSMTRVGALARANDGELAALTQKASDLGRDTRFSGIQAAEGMQYLAQSGFKTNEIIGSMKGMLNIASAGAVDLGTAADITSNILRGFGMQAAESERLGDVLTNTFTNSSTNLSQLGETMKYVAPIARATNVSLETTAAAAGLLGNAGIKGEQAGTALRAMLTRLAAPVHKAQIVLGQLGVKTKDAHGNMRPLADTLADLNAKMAKYGNGTRQAMTSSIFGMEAATAATVLLGEAGSGSLQKFTEAVKRTGTAQGIADKANATMAGQWDNLKGSVEVLAIKIGEALIPSLKRLIDKIVPVVNNVTEWMKKNPQLTDTVVKVGAAVSVTTLALTAAAFAFRGAKLAILATEGAMLLLNKATWKAAGAWAAANAPILFAAIGIAGLAIAAYSVYEAWNPVSQWFAELWDDALDGLGRYLGAIKTLAKVAQFIPGMSGLSGAVALIPDIGTDHRGARNRRFNEEAFNRLAPYSSLGGPMREDQKPWSMFDGADKLKSGGSGDITVHAPINITLPTGTPDETRKAIEGASKMGARELGDLLKRVFAESARTSLD